MPYALEPLVAGELGPETELDPSTHPPKVSAVEYVLDAPPDDDIIESFPVWLVSDELGARLGQEGLTGFELRDAKVTTSETYADLSGDGPHKAYRWLVVDGAADADFRVGDDLLLTVSDRAMRVLETADLSGCDIEPR